MFNNLPHFDMSPILSQLGLESDPRGGNRTRTLPSESGSDWSLFANELFFLSGRGKPVDPLLPGVITARLFFAKIHMVIWVRVAVNSGIFSCLFSSALRRGQNRVNIHDILYQDILY